MSQSEITGEAHVPGPDRIRRPSSNVPGIRQSGWVARHLPIPIVIFGLAATLAWAGVIGWWLFGWFRWAVG